MRQGEPIELRLAFHDKQVNAAAAREEYTYEWIFEPDGQKKERLVGLALFHGGDRSGTSASARRLRWFPGSKRCCPHLFRLGWMRRTHLST